MLATPEFTRIARQAAATRASAPPAAVSRARTPPASGAPSSLAQTTRRSIGPAAYTAARR